MRLNDMKPARGSRFEGKRRGRGAASGLGKTGGRGTKGQHARSGGYRKVGFEGGQMPIHRRLPKIGFRSKLEGRTAQVRVHELARFAGGTTDLEALKAARIVPKAAGRAKIIASGSLKQAVTVTGVSVTPGARKIIEAAGGKVD